MVAIHATNVVCIQGALILMLDNFAPCWKMISMLGNSITGDLTLELKFGGTGFSVGDSDRNVNMNLTDMISSSRYLIMFVLG